MARRHHAVRLPVRHRARSTRRTGVVPVLADDLATGSFELRAEVVFDGVPPEVGWQVEARLGDLPARSRHPCRPPGASRARPAAHRRALADRAIAGLRLSDAVRGSRASPRRGSGRRSTGGSCCVPTSPASARGRPRLHLVALAVPLRSPAARWSRRSKVSGRLPVSRGRRPRLLVNGAAVPIHGVNRHDFEQHTGRVVCREVDARGHRADEAAQLQRRAHLALPQRPALPRPVRRSGLYVIDEADIESHAHRHASATTRALDAVGRPRPAHGRRDKNHPSSSSGRWATSPATAPTTTPAAGWLRRYDPHAPDPLRGRDQVGLGGDRP